MFTTFTGQITAEDQIIAAYRASSTHNGSWTTFAELRATLPHLTRREFDQAIATLAECPDVYLTPEMNQKLLTEKDHAAAVRVGGEDKHLMRIYR